jgi:Tfp pilus assembly protein FimT
VRRSRLSLPPRSTTTSAFTLLELLLTLAVLAAITAVSIPHLGSLLSDRRLARAGDQVQAEMARLRVDAMRQGRVMMLEAMSGGSSIRIKPFQSVADATEAIDQTGSQSALLSGATQGSMTTTAADQSERLIELPAEVAVESVSVVSAARAAEIEQSSLADQTAGWSRPILFYPDGSTSTAAVVIQHPSVGRLTVKLRGITGEATVGEVMP